MNTPTLFRTEAITKLGQSVEGIESDITALETSVSNVKSIAEQALELAQNGGGGGSGGGSDEAYEAADEVQEADEQVVENLLNYDEYDYTDLAENQSVFKVNSCKVRKYHDNSVRFFLTITTKTFPAIVLQEDSEHPELVLYSTTLMSADSDETIELKTMGGVQWVYIKGSGLICNLESFQHCSPGEQYTIACEISAENATHLHIPYMSNVPSQTIEVTMPEGTTAYDYTYDITNEVNALQSKTQTKISFTSVRMTIRNYDRYYVHFSYSGTFNDAYNTNSSATALTSDYITATAELYPSPASTTGNLNFLPYIYPTVGLVFITAVPFFNDDPFSGETTIICPLNATMTINTSNLKQLETNGGKLKMTSAATVKSSQVRYKLIDLSGAGWVGSVNFVQDQLGVFVILSVGVANDRGTNAYYGGLTNGLANVFCSSFIKYTIRSI